MYDRRWYEAEALMADSTNRRHEPPPHDAGAPEAEVERWMMDRYLDGGSDPGARQDETEGSV